MIPATLPIVRNNPILFYNPPVLGWADNNALGAGMAKLVL